MKKVMKKNLPNRYAILPFLLLLLPLFLLCGCSESEEEEGFLLYYPNAEMGKLLSVPCEMEGDGLQEQLSYVLDRLGEQPEGVEMVKTIPSSVRVQDFSMRAYQLTIDFSEEYYEMSAAQEALTRAAVVKTLVQVPGVSFIDFTVNGEGLLNALGETVGTMNADSFVENPGEQINSSIEAQLTLYFANESGTALVKEKRIVHYSSNISLEKLVVEQLLEGPKSEGARATLSTETKLITISVVDGICYVNFDDTISTANPDIAEEIVLYSIVNSLTELSSVDQVQISVNGSTDGSLRVLYDLSALYEGNDSYLKGEALEAEE